MPSILHLAAVTALSTAAFAQFAPMEDVLWLSTGNDIASLDRFGRITRTIGEPARIAGAPHRAPDGTVWTFTTSPVRIQRRDRDGVVLSAQPVPTAGVPTALAFDAAGDAWITAYDAATALGTLLRFAPDGTFRRSFPVAAEPTDVEIGADGTVWILQANLPGPLLSLLTPATGAARNFSLPASLGSATDIETTPWGTAVVATSNAVVEVDRNGVVLRSVAPLATPLRIALRASGEVLGYASPTASVLAIDLATGTSRFVCFCAPWGARASLAVDALGGIWVVTDSRGPGVIRVDEAQQRTDVAALAGTGGIVFDDAAGYHRALVVAPDRDDDGDGTPNGAELQVGTNPYDAQSSPAASLRTERITYRQFDHFAIDVRGVGGQGLVLFGLGTRSGQAGLPGFVGSLRLDPAQTVPIALPTSVPGEVGLPIPDDPTLGGTRFFAQAVVGLIRPRFTEEVGVHLDQPRPYLIVEGFNSDHRLDRDRSSGTWAGGSARGGQLGGTAILGDFDHTHGVDLGNGVWLWSTDDQSIPASSTLDGEPRRVTDGRFDFAQLVVPAGVTVRFRGSHAAVIRVSGRCAIQGVLDLAGELVRGVHNGRNSTVVGSTVIPGPGQSGSEGGAGGGRGGDGAWGCDGTGNPNQPQLHGFGGYDGEDVSVAAGHAYAVNAIGTGGRGSALFPAHGDHSLLVYGGLSNNFALETAAGGGGAGFRIAGQNGVCANAGAITGFPPFPNTTPAHRGPDGVGGAAFGLLPAPSAVPSLDHFLVGGSGGGGGGSHPVFALAVGGSDLVKFRSGGAGAGGGGALALRVGRLLDVAAGAVIDVRGGSCEPSANAPQLGTRGVPAPGGGGSGGSVLLQVDGTVTQNGTVDVRGGAGSVVALSGFFLLDTRGGDGAAGSLRLEVPQPSPPVTLAGTTLPAASPNEVGTLADRDPVTVQLSTRYLAPSDQTLLHYELDVRIGGVLQTFTDDPARFRPANGLGLPVRIRFQSTDLQGPVVGPWRDLVTARVPGQPGLASDHPTAFRIELLFDTGAPSVAVEELRVLAR